MKITLQPSQFTFNPGSNIVDFSPMAGAFKPECLLAVIDTTTGKLVYAAASSVAGYGGNFSTNVYTNDTLNYSSSNAGQSPSDILEILYDDQSYIQPIAASDGTQILTTTDAMSLEEGLNINLLNSSFGGQIGQPIPLPNNNNALSVGFLNGGVLVSPAMDPVSNQLIVQTTGAAGTSDVNLISVNGATLNLGQQPMSASLPVVLPSDQPLNVDVTNSFNSDVLGTSVTGNRNNQIEISFASVPSATFITNTFTGSGGASASNGHTIYSTGTTPSSSARGVSVQLTNYRPGFEVYAQFTAAFLSPVASSYQRIGLYDNTDGFYIGYEGTTFGLTWRSAGGNTVIPQTSFNTDALLGGSTSKFTRGGIPEALDTTKSNLFRIRFAWLGSANIYFEVFSPDGEWVLFHNIRQPNSAYNPSVTNPNLPMQVDVTKGAGSNNPSIATACWSAGSTSSLQPINSTLTDLTLASLNRSVITGVTTGGGGGYVNVKVNPSGALTTETTVSGTVSTSISNTFPELFVTGQSGQSALINNIIPGTASASATDITGYRTGYVQVVCSAGISAGAFIFEISNDNVNFQATPVLNQSLITGAATSGAIAASANTQIIYAFPITARYLRLRISTAIVGGTIQAFSRFTQASYTPAITSVAQPTAAQLNANVSGTVTVTQPTPANLNVTALVSGATLASASVIDIANATQTTTQTSGNISTLNTMAATFQVTTTATAFNAGTVLDVVVEETLDGANYYTLYAFERISTTNAVVRSPVIKLSGTGIRYVRTISGGAPSSIQNAVTRISRAGQAETIRRFINRTIDPNTLNSTTGAFFCDGVEDFNLIVRCTAQTTAATIALEFSTDNTNWFTSATTVTTVNGIVKASYTNEQWKFVRATVTAAGTGITLDNVYIGGHSA